MSRSKAKGTAWESAIVRYLTEHGFPHAERRALTGSQDRGDIAGLPGIVVEAKNRATTSLGVWMDEALVEQANDGADYAAVWHHRAGKASPADGYVTMTGAAWVRLIRQAGYGTPGDALHPTCIDVSTIGQRPGSSYVCGADCPPRSSAGS